MSTTDDLRTGLGTLVTGLHQVASAVDLPAIVAPLVAECQRPPGAAARVVVAGATKRGKSALVNAVLDRPGLVPVDTDVATGVHIAVRYGAQERARVHVAGAEPIDIALADVERYASERHNPGNALDVSAVEIEVPAPLLAGGLELVDTPGVDSVVARHADVTLAALALADALVLVVDPGRPLIAPELAFLGEATQRVGHVVFVLTKLDLHREWRRVLDDDRALVATHAPRFARAPFLPVSGRLMAAASDARRRGRDALADKVAAESGGDALVAELAKVGAELETVRLGNVVQLGLVTANRLTAAVRAARPPADDPAAAAAVEQERATLRRLTDTGTRWRQELAHAFRRLQLDLEAHLAASATRTDQDISDSLETWSDQRADTIGRELDDAVRVLWLDAVVLVRERVETIVADLVAVVADHGVELARPELELPVLRRDPTRRPDADDDPSQRGLAGALGSYGAAAGMAFGADRMLALLSPLLGPVGLGLGAAIGIAGIAMRRRAMDRMREHRAAQRLATRTIADARAHTQREFTKHLVDVQFGLEQVVHDLLTARRRELDEGVKRSAALLKATAEERERQRKVTDDALAALEGLRRDAAALHRIVENTRATPIPATT
ncbi:dynamin family protein [Actinomycetospora aeridis]|uniref:Dynamin family protein n=1 Tax=Actinomycetospora aeridis TaxID=3129231 RepID=A0ABU8N688_9PSEU